MGVMAQHHVADGATAQRGDEGDDHDAKDIHIAPACSKGAGHGFGGNGHQIDDQHDGEVGGLERVQQRDGGKHEGT